MMAGLIDTHCHLASARFTGEADEVVRRAVAAGVVKIVTLATGFDDMAENLAAAAAHPGIVHVALGIHPCEAHSVDAAGDWRARLARLSCSPLVCAIGETGLDYYHPPPEGWDEEAHRAQQLALLRGHFEMAADLGLPVVLHTRDRTGNRSVDDALAVAQDFRGRVRAMFHCFPGPVEVLEKILAIDGMVSYGGVATFASARATMAAVRATPAGAFTLETDAPYLAPVPHRGKRNEPAYVVATAQAIATARGETLERLAAHTSAAALRFFRFAATGASTTPSPNPCA